MENTEVNETTEQLLKSSQEVNQVVIESIVVAQEGSAKIVQSTLTDWIRGLKSGMETTQTLMREMEQQTHKQQAALQELTEQSIDSYFNFLRASPSFSVPPSLQLTENLQICLLAFASRYPQHIVDINEQLLGPQSLGACGWKAADLIELFQSTASELLQEMARLEVNANSRGIYLLERSGQTPALWVHSGEAGEKMPAYQGNVATRRQQQTPAR